jgi:hypothetical protein
MLKKVNELPGPEGKNATMRFALRHLQGIHAHATGIAQRTGANATLSPGCSKPGMRAATTKKIAWPAQACNHWRAFGVSASLGL